MEPAESAEVPAMEPAGRAASGAGQGKPGLKRLRKGPAVTAASPAKEVRCSVGCFLVSNRMLCQAEVHSSCNMRRVEPASCLTLQ